MSLRTPPMPGGGSGGGRDDLEHATWRAAPATGPVRVVAVPQRGAGTVYAALILRNGVEAERDPAHAGYVHAAEHLFSMFTSRRAGHPNKRALLRELATRGVSTNAWTSAYETAFYLQGRPSDLRMFISLLGGMMTDFVFAADADDADAAATTTTDSEWAKQRAIILQELRAQLDSPWHRMHERHIATRYAAGHPFARSTRASIENIERTRRADTIIAFFRDLIRDAAARGGATLVLAGDLIAGTTLAPPDADAASAAATPRAAPVPPVTARDWRARISQWIDAAFARDDMPPPAAAAAAAAAAGGGGASPAPAPLMARPNPDEPTSGIRIINVPNTERARILFDFSFGGGSADAAFDPRLDAHLDALTRLVASGYWSRLTQQLRESRGLVYGVSAEIERPLRNHTDWHHITIGFECEPANIERVLSGAAHVLAHFAAEGPTDDEMRRLRNENQQRRAAHRLDAAPAKFAHHYAHYVSWNRPVVTFATEFACENEVRARSLRSLAAHIFGDPRHRLVMVGLATTPTQRRHPNAAAALTADRVHAALRLGTETGTAAAATAAAAATLTPR